MSELKLTERIAYDYRGVTIYIDMDYERGLVSFANKDGSKKNYLFQQRTRRYLGGWWLILEALQEATKLADSKLAEQAELREQIKEKKVIDMMIALSDIKQKKAK